MLRPSHRIDDRAGAFPAAVGAEDLGDANQFLWIAAADARDKLRRIALIVLAQKVHHTAGMLQRRVLGRTRRGGSAARRGVGGSAAHQAVTVHAFLTAAFSLTCATRPRTTGTLGLRL